MDDGQNGHDCLRYIVQARSDACLKVYRYCQGSLIGRYSSAKMRFQSFFMAITVQPSFIASS
jgi:hypothetical protein